MKNNKAFHILILLSMLAGFPTYAGTHPHTGIVDQYRVGGRVFECHLQDSLPSHRFPSSVKSSLVLDTLLLLSGSTDSSMVKVLLPDEGNRKDSRYPVLYILENREPGIWKQHFESLMLLGNFKSIWVIFRLPESDSAFTNRSLWLASLKSFIENRYPVLGQTASHHLAGMGECGGMAFRLLLQEPGNFGNGIFFLGNNPFSDGDLSLLRTEASRLSGKYCFVLSDNNQANCRENWLDTLALLSHGIIYAHCLNSGMEAQFPLAYAWLMADGPNKLVNSSD